MNDMLLQRELRMESQIYDLSSQLNTVLSAIDVLRKEKVEPTSQSDIRMVPARVAIPSNLPLAKTEEHVPSTSGRNTFKSTGPSTSQSTGPTVPTVKESVSMIPDAERKPARVQLRLKNPHDSSSCSVIPPSTTAVDTRDQGVDPIIITLDSTEADVASTRATLGSQTDDANYVTARATFTGPNLSFLTADSGEPSGTPCASSTRKKEQATMDQSVEATHGSDSTADDPEHQNVAENVISPEQLRFTAAMSKAMSKELAPLLAGRDLAQTKPSVYRGSREGSVDGWILLMRRYHKRTQSKAPLDDQSWSNIGHLEGEARNYIINKAKSERDTPERVFELLSSRFGTGGNRMQVRQAFLSQVQSKKEDWMQYLDALEGLRSHGFPQESITSRRYEILQRFMEGVRDPMLRRDLAIVYASETFLTEPPTVESLRFTARQQQRNRPKAPQQPYDPRLAMRSRPHPFVPLQPTR